MRGAWWTISAAAATLVLFLGVQPAGAQQSTGTRSPSPAAKVEGEVITFEEVEQGLAAQLGMIEVQRYALIEERLQQLIGDRLLAQEARKRGVAIDQLLKVEVNDKVADVSDAEVTTFITQNRARLPQGDETALAMKVRDYLRRPGLDTRRQAFIQSLRGQSTVAVYLEAPAPVRRPVSAGAGFVRGAPDAPVTIVEFSDFQCPFCKRATTILKEVLEMYPGKVKLVFRDFPIPSLHPAALKAHQAARCAGEQGKFWEYHDVLFEKSPGAQDLIEYAKGLELDGATFSACLDGGKHDAELSLDLDEGTRLGVTATPTFFINGRELIGAQPATAFQKLIDSELADKSSPPNAPR
jgi:protein-disulfide isomerase